MSNWKKTLRKDISEIVDVNKDDLEMVKDDLYKLFLEYPEIVKNCSIPDVGRSKQLKAFLTWLEKEGGSHFIDKDALMDKIITSYDYPPIPMRDYDWSAIREDYEPGDLIGTGKTEQDAIKDLERQENER